MTSDRRTCCSTPVSCEITAVLDWELVRTGAPGDDLAWVEWIVRTHHPDLVEHLPALFAGYGGEPAWATRRSAMLASCARALDFVIRWNGPDSASADTWRRRTAVTAQFNG